MFQCNRLMWCQAMLAALIALVALQAAPAATPPAVEEEEHNCRMWGIVADYAPEAVILEHLISLPNSLENLSPANTDGWGIGYFSDGSLVPTILRGYPPAYTDPNYDPAVAQAAAATPQLAIAHVRNASTGLIPATGDPHPFERIKNGRHWLFEHNGTVDRLTVYNLIRPDYMAANPVQYGHVITNWNDVIDSELYFLFLLQTLEDFNWQVKPALGYAIKTLRDAIPGTDERINFLLTDGTTIWGYRQGSSVHTLYYYYNTVGTPYSAVASQYPTSTQGDWVFMENGDLVTLRQSGAPVLESIEDYFGDGLIADNNFDVSATSEELRAAGDWYESRNDLPTLLTLDQTNVGGNGSKKAAFAASTAGNVYLSQAFGSIPTGQVSLRWDVYVDRILDDANRDRSALQLIGQDLDAANGPNSTSTERYVFLAFYAEGGAETGAMSLIAREPGDDYATSTAWLTVASGLELDRWYTIQVDCDLNSDTYDVYINGALAYDGVQAFTAMDQLTHVSFAQWNDGPGSFYVDNVYEGGTLISHTLTVAVTPAGSGTTAPTVGAYNYGDGEVVIISAAPAAGYEFDFWTGDVADPASATTTVVMDQNQTVTAHFSLLPVYFLTDNQFDEAADSDDLRADGPGQDWYESRGDLPSLVTLNTDNVGGNVTPKARFQASNTNNVYLSQAFGVPQTGVFSAQWDIYVDEILDRTGPDYSGWMSIGDDADGIRGPNSTSNDRFVYLAFEKDGGGTDGTMDLVARETGAAWDAFTTLVSGLNLDQWYTIGVTVDVGTDTYDVYVDGNLVYDNLPAYANKSAVTHISFAQWNDGSGTFYVDNVWESFTLNLQTAPVAGGATDPSVGLHLYADGEEAVIEALPAVGYDFDYWDGPVFNSGAALTSLVMDDNYLVTANFSLAPVALLADSEFDTSLDSDDLRANGTGQDWYESRGQYPALLTLNNDNIGGNSGAKAALAASTAYNAYLTQEFFEAPTSTFSVQWDIYVDNLIDNGDMDRGALQLIGQDLDGTSGPNSTSNERFVFLAFYAPGGAETGVMNLIAREAGDTYNTSTAWRAIASGLALDAWHTIRVDGNLGTDTYDVYVDGVLAASGVAAYAPMTQVTHLSFAQWNDGSGAFYVDKVSEVAAPVYTLTLGVDPAGSGTTTPPVGPHDYADGQVVAVTAHPAAGYQFDSWSGDVADPFTAATSVTMDGDKTVTANFTPLAGGSIADGDFSASASSEDLRADGAGQDWYESRGDDPTLVTLNTANVVGNATAKAAFAGSPVGNVYLSQEFASPLSGTFALQWDIVVEEILDISNPDRTGWMLVGDATDPNRPGPNSDPSERFVQMAFFRDGGGTSGSMDLVARERNAGFTEFTTVAGGLQIGQWYTIKVVCHLDAGTYDVYVDDVYQATMSSYQAKSVVTHLSYGQWNDGAGSFYVDNVAEVSVPPTYALTIQVEPGGCADTDPSVGVHDCPQGAYIAVSAAAHAGFEFGYWSGDVLDPNSASTEVLMDGDKTITAHFTEVPIVFLADNDFAAATSSADLRTDGAGQDWYESRGDNPALLLLNNDDIAGNATAKAELLGSASSNVYLTQEFGAPQSGLFAAQWDIYVDEILNISDPDRAGWMLIGDASNTTRPGANSDPSERFVQMAFFRDGGATTGTMDLVARERGASFTDFTTVASGLSMDEWHTINVVCDLDADVYMVYVNGTYRATVTSYNEKVEVTHISFAQWNDGAGTFYVDNVYEGTLPATYYLTLDVNPPGTGETAPAIGSHAYLEGMTVPVSATGLPGYAFVSWTGDVADPAAQATTVTIDGDKTITANFIEAAGSVHGLVTSGGVGLHGVYVDLYDPGHALFMRVITDVNGYYSMLNLPASRYTLAVQLPMGMTMTPSTEVPLNITDADLEVNFPLTNAASGSVADYWWWLRQLEAIAAGSPDPYGITRAAIDSYGQKIFQGYYGREDGHQIRIENVTYIGDPARPLTCQDIIDLWVTLVDDSNEAKAREHLLCCMLNVAADRLSQLRVVTADGATASQTIRAYADSYLAGGASSFTFWFNLMKVHMNQLVPAGQVPLSTANIMYGGSGEISRPPMIDCPSEPIAVSVCGPGPLCVPLAIQDYGAVTVSPSGSWSGGQLCFDVEAIGTYTFHVTATATDAAYSAAECDLSVEVGLIAAPQIACPTDTAEIFSCNPGQVCIELVVTNATTVTAPGASWTANQLCFIADTAGLYTFTVTAANSCSSVICTPVVRVTLGQDVTIACAADTLSTYLCEAGTVCVDMAIANQTEVTVEGAAWADGQLCFMADTAGLYTYAVTATNECDTAVCATAVRVTFNPVVTITCPVEPAAVVMCYPGAVCLPLPIVNHENVTVEGATWTDGQLCFVADTTGLYTYTVTAANGCGSTQCEISAQVYLGPAVDLYVTSDDLSLSPPHADQGETVAMTAVIRSDARSLEEVAVVVRVYDGDPDDGGILVADGVSEPVGAGEAVTYAAAFEVQGTPPLEVFVVIDPDNSLDECDEENNRASVVLQGGTPEGAVGGMVLYEGAGMLGVPVTLLDDGSNPVRELYTGADGAYLIEELTDGEYLVEITVPLGFSPITPAAVPVTVSGGPVVIDFALDDIASGSVTDWWWWQRQIAAIRSGTPLFLGITQADVETYSQRIFDHFFDRSDGYAIQIANCTFAGDPARPLTFDEIAYIFLDAHDDSAPAKARSYLLTCLLNIASNRLSQLAIVSADGATASQAMTYFASQYLYGNPNDWTLWYNLMKIHTRQVIAAGIIPLGTPNVMFKPSDENWDNLPAEFSLSQNYPNPFNPTTDIRFTLPTASPVKLEVFDVIGRRVTVLLDQMLEAGQHEVRWDASGTASGVYLYRLTASGSVETRKMLLLK